MVTLHESKVSGNCYKIRLLLTQLGIPFRSVEYDLSKGEARTPEFNAKFPLGRVPVVELDDGRQIAESNAVLCYFAEGTKFIPADKFARAEMMQWLFWEQYSHEPAIAVVRAWRAYFGVPAGKERELEERTAKGYAALDVMERRLTERSYFAGNQYSIADIALFAYTHVAGDGGFELSRYGAVSSWLQRVKSQPDFVPMF